MVRSKKTRDIIDTEHDAANVASSSQNTQQKESNTAHAASNINQSHSSNKYTFPLPNIQTNDNVPPAIKNYIDEVFEKHAHDTLIQNKRM